MNGFVVLYKEGPQSSLASSVIEDTARRWPSRNQEVGLHQTPVLYSFRIWFVLGFRGERSWYLAGQ